MKRSRGIRSLSLSIPLFSVFFLICGAVCPEGCGGAADKSEYRTIEGEIWTTGFHITYRADSGHDIESGDCNSAFDGLRDSVMAEFRIVDERFSMFNPVSMVSEVNSNRDLVVDSIFTEIFELAKRISALSGGKYDPTVAPLVNLWGFGRMESSSSDSVFQEAPSGNEKCNRSRNHTDDHIPSERDIMRVRQLVGIADCAISNGRVLKKSPGTEFDFSSIAKGYAVDRICKMLERNGIFDYMVEVGGEVRARGTNPRNKKWHVEIFMPLEDSDEGVKGGDNSKRLIEPDGKAVATSGVYHRKREIKDGADGSVYGHIINPLTGMAEPYSLSSVTVIAPTCAEADAIATACFLMDMNEIRALTDSLPEVTVII